MFGVSRAMIAPSGASSYWRAPKLAPRCHQNAVSPGFGRVVGVEQVRAVIGPLMATGRDEEPAHREWSV